jgi:hypothetical protein
MYDAWKILVGLAIFLGLFTFAFWMNAGRAAPVPEPKIDTPEIKKMAVKQCVEDKVYMRTTHMQLVNVWRDEALRENNREFINQKGEKYVISLQNTCLKCHSNKKEFCDACHNYTAVAPYCWDCHIVPPEEPKEEPKGNES